MEICRELAYILIKEIKEKYKVDVFAICSDKIENKIKTLRKLIENDYPHILTHGCSAHFLNLLESVVTLKNIIKHIVEVQKYFRNYHQPHGWLINKNSMMPQISNDTRWNSQKECVRTFVENFHKYNEIRMEQSIDSGISNILSNKDLYVEAKNLLNQLIIVGNSLDLLQSDITSIAKAVEIWMNLIKSSELSNYRDDINNRFQEKSIQEQSISRLNSDQELQAKDWLKKNQLEYYLFLCIFRIRNIFHQTCFQKM